MSIGSMRGNLTASAEFRHRGGGIGRGSCSDALRRESRRGALESRSLRVGKGYVGEAAEIFARRFSVGDAGLRERCGWNADTGPDAVKAALRNITYADALLKRKIPGIVRVVRQTRADAVTVTVLTLAAIPRRTHAAGKTQVAAGRSETHAHVPRGLAQIIVNVAYLGVPARRAAEAAGRRAAPGSASLRSREDARLALSRDPAHRSRLWFGALIFCGE